MLLSSRAKARSCNKTYNPISLCCGLPVHLRGNGRTLSVWLFGDGFSSPRKVCGMPWRAPGARGIEPATPLLLARCPMAWRLEMESRRRRQGRAAVAWPALLRTRASRACTARRDQPRVSSWAREPRRLRPECFPSLPRRLPLAVRDLIESPRLHLLVKSCDCRGHSIDIDLASTGIYLTDRGHGIGYKKLQKQP